MRALCVFCGSSSGARPAYADLARVMGQAVAARGLGLVYGGARVGLMGVVADACMAAGGRVTGVMPKSLVEREIAHSGLAELHEVASMHERKAMMADLSDGFVAMPGGAGTLEELFEVWTWGQLGYHDKPVAFLNTESYFDPLIAFIDHAVAEGFLRREHADMILVETDPDRMLDAIAAWRPRHVAKWIGAGER